MAMEAGVAVKRAVSKSSRLYSNPGWDLARVQHLLYRDAPDRAALAEFADLTGLSASWRALALRRLESGAVEDWAPRLSG